MRIKWVGVFLSISLLFLVAGRGYAGYDEGVAAYEREDYVTALRELMPVAKSGDAYAQGYVGVIYQYGLGVPSNLEKAVHWYGKAAKNGDSMSQRILGDLHAEGTWGKRDYVAAAQWYELAAKAGDKDAQRKLGNLYLEGHGVGRDYNVAAKWLQQAAWQDDSEARKILRTTFVNRGGEKSFRGETSGQTHPALRSPSNCDGGFPNAPYDINVQIIFPKARINHTHSIAELGKISGFGHDVRAIGLMKPDLVIETRPRAQGLPMGQRFCFWLTGFDVKLRYRRVDVFVAREYPRGSCPYNAILEHEREHVRVAKQNLQEFAPRIRRALTSLLIPTGKEPVMVASAKHAQIEVKSISDELLQPIYKDMMASLKLAQKKVDTPMSYARVRSKCRDW